MTPKRTVSLGHIGYCSRSRIYRGARPVRTPREGRALQHIAPAHPLRLPYMYKLGHYGYSLPDDYHDSDG